MEAKDDEDHESSDARTDFDVLGHSFLPQIFADTNAGLQFAFICESLRLAYTPNKICQKFVSNG
jgi:hypothetical protein